MNVPEKIIIDDYHDYSMLRIRDLARTTFTYRDKTEVVKTFVKMLVKDELEFPVKPMRDYYSTMLDRCVLLNEAREIVFSQGLMDSDLNYRTWNTFFMDGSLLTQSINQRDMDAVLYFAQGIDQVNIAGVLDNGNLDGSNQPMSLWCCKTEVSLFDLSKPTDTLPSKPRYDIRKAPIPSSVTPMNATELDCFMVRISAGWGYCNPNSMGESNGFQQSIIWRWVQACTLNGDGVLLSLRNEHDQVVSIVGGIYDQGYWQYTALWQPIEALTGIKSAASYGISSILALILHLKSAGEHGKLLLTIPSLTGKNELESYEAYKRKFEHEKLEVYSWFARNGQASRPCFNLTTQQILLKEV